MHALGIEIVQLLQANGNDKIYCLQGIESLNGKNQFDLSKLAATLALTDATMPSRTHAGST